MKKEFLAFLIQKETPPKWLQEVARKDITLSFRSRSIITKFLLFQLIGALFSMSVCPQFGLGLVDGHGISHHFRMIGDWACAAFCGSLFLSSGVAAAFIGMKGEEIWWVWRRYKFPLIILPAAFWSFLMVFNFGLNLQTETTSYHLIWFGAAVMTMALWMQIRSLIYQKVWHAR